MRFFGKRLARTRAERGQATLEYILMLVVGIAAAIMVIQGVLRPLTEEGIKLVSEKVHRLMTDRDTLYRFPIRR